MKECCKVGDEKPVPSWKKWLKRVVYILAVTAVFGLLVVEVIKK